MNELKIAKVLACPHLITLEETPEREALAVSAIKQILPHSSIEIHRFKRMKPGWKGCIDSHLQVYQWGIDNQEDILFICEDNVAANKFPSIEGLQRLNSFVNDNHEWTVIFMGGYIQQPWRPCIRVAPSIYRTYDNNHGSVSYLVHRRFFAQAVTTYRTIGIEEHFDIYLDRVNECMIFRDMMFWHAHNITSNINQHSDWWRKFWFSPKMMRLHHMIFFNQDIILYVLFAAVLAALARERKTENSRYRLEEAD